MSYSGETSTEKDLPAQSTLLQKTARAGAAFGLVLALGLSLRFFILDYDSYELSRSWGNLLYVIPPPVPFAIAFLIVRRRTEPLLLIACLLFEAVALLFCAGYADYDTRWRDKPGSYAPLVYLITPILQMIVLGLTVGLTAAALALLGRRNRN